MSKKEGYLKIKMSYVRSKFDLSFLLDPPAGKHGFLKVRDGHFYFEDGVRGRFWGVDSQESFVRLTYEQIKDTVDWLASYGCNIVRIYWFDYWSLIDYENYEDSQHFRPEAMDRLDYAINELKSRGIYIDFCLLGGRRFREGDGVPQADELVYAAKPASLFDPRLIELQKKFAQDFLTHMNPYTGLRYKDDPAVVMVELTNENTLFWQNYLDLPEYYVNELKRLWNKWLLKRYNNREGIAKAWTDYMGTCALLPMEDPEEGTVTLPNLMSSWGNSSWNNRSYVDPLDGTARCNDASIFIYELLRKYYREMKEHLKSIGLKVPITTVARNHIPPDLKAVSDELDYICNGYYWDHPDWLTQPGPLLKQGDPLYQINAEEDRKIASMTQHGLRGNVSELKEYDLRCLPPWVSLSKIAGKPLVTREWGPGGEYRAPQILQMAAYACLQDWDGIMITGLRSRESSEERGKDSWVNDPVCVGLYPIAALIFHRRDVATARHVVDVGYSNVDTFYVWHNMEDPAKYVPYVMRVQKRFFDEQYDGDSDIAIASGASSSGDYSKACRAMIWALNPFEDLHNKFLGRERQANYINPTLEFEPLHIKRDRLFYYPWELETWIHFENFLFDEMNCLRDVEPLIKTSAIPLGAKSFGTTTGLKPGLCIGYIDDKHMISPHLSAIEDPRRLLLYRFHNFQIYVRAFLDAMRYWDILKTSHKTIDEGYLESETGELCQNFVSGILTINTSRTQAALGFIGERKIDLENVTIEARTPHCVISVSSLNEKPINESSYLLIAAIGDAINSDEIIEPSFDESIWFVRSWGRGPILYKPVDAKITLKIGRDNQKIRVYACDYVGNRLKKVPTSEEKDKLYFNCLTDENIVYYEVLVQE